MDENDLYPQVLGRRMGDRITVMRRPPASPWGTIEDAKDVYIRSIAHTWSRPNKWSTTWGLQPVEKLTFFVPTGHPAVKNNPRLLDLFCGAGGRTHRELVQPVRSSRPIDSDDDGHVWFARNGDSHSRISSSA